VSDLTQAVSRVSTARSLLRVVSCIRFDEVVVLQGSPMIGAIAAIGNLTTEKVEALALLIAGSCCLVAHVFALNDWAGISYDLKDSNRSVKVFITKGVSRSEIGYLWLGLLVLSLMLISPLGWVSLVITLAIAGVGAIYSVLAKGVPVLNSALHLVGGVLHFLLGYSLFSAINGRGILIALFFALTFVAGHLTHEARDRDGDLHNGIRTNAVALGIAPVFLAGLTCFTMAYALLVVLAACGTVPHALILVAALYPLHLYWSLQALRAGLTFASVRRLQVRYRALYAGIGLMIVSTVLFAH
jgi:4-hydroxybenzoate polyprenyltransferase